MTKKRTITITDIAKSLGISASTVSRALKGHPSISKPTRDKVLALAKKWHYVPNKIALSLKHSHTKTLGLIVPEIVHYFFASVVAGIEEVANDNGFSLLICQSNEQYENELKATQTLVRQRVDGLLVSCSRETLDFEHFESLPADGIPVVYFDRVPPASDLPQITVNDFEGARMATKHLIEQGCQRIAHLAGPQNLVISKKRLEGYQAALKTANISFESNLVQVCRNGTSDVGYESMMNLLASGELPDAVFANNDIVALGAMQAIKKQGLRIPEDIAVVGFSNWQLAEYMEPGLSSVEQPGLEIGRQSCACLLALIDSEEGSIADNKIVLPTKLVVRGSSQRRQLENA